MIINTGMRTDIPAFYSTWLLNRLRAGYVYTRNPYHPSAVTRYSLSPEVVDVLAFCTKNPAPMLPHMEALSPYGQYWFVTITPYGAEVEPNVPDKEAVMDSFQTLSSLVGADAVGWRYDPIMVTEEYSVDWHIRQFERMAGRLSGYTHTCVISFIDIYKKVERNFPRARAVSSLDRRQIGQAFAKIGREYDMVIKACAEGEELASFGVDCKGCMTKEVFERAVKCRLDPPKKKSQRAECACLLGNDIGQYDTCGHLCKYCYANAGSEAVRRNMKNHDPESPFLVGGLLPGDRIHEAEQKSWKNGQRSMFDTW